MIRNLAVFTCHHARAKERYGYVKDHAKLFDPFHKVVKVADPLSSVFGKLRWASIEACKHASVEYTLAESALVANWLLYRAGNLLNSSAYLLEIVRTYMNLNFDNLPQWLSPRLLLDSEISLCMKHRYAYSYFIAHTNFEYALILEDDAIITDHSFSSLVDILEYCDTVRHSGAVYFEFSAGWKLLLSGISSPEFSLRSGIGMYSPVYPSTRSTCAYLINRFFAERFLSEYPHALAPIDYELIFLMNKLKQNNRLDVCLWCEPAIFTHGSESPSIISLI